MAEPPAAASSGVAVLERDVLLATKLHMPAPQPGLVPRPRLTERLDEGLARGLVLVCGPAGYGKTVLLADWARQSELPADWLSLDAGDNDPARFWRHAADPVSLVVRRAGRPSLLLSGDLTYGADLLQHGQPQASARDGSLPRRYSGSQRRRTYMLGMAEAPVAPRTGMSRPHQTAYSHVAAGSGAAAAADGRS